MSYIYQPFRGKVGYHKWFSFQGRTHILEPTSPHNVISESADDYDLLPPNEIQEPVAFKDIWDFPNLAIRLDTNPDRIPDQDDICFACRGTGKSLSTLGQAAGLACVVCAGSGRRWAG